MALTYVSTGGLFKRIGHLAGGLADVLALKGAPATARVLSGAFLTTRSTTIEADAAESPAVSNEIDGHWTALSSFQSATSGIFSSYRTLAEKIFVRQVYLDAGISSLDLVTALQECIRQMRVTGDDINGSTVSVGSQTSVPTPIGNPIFVVSLRTKRGEVVQTAFQESLRIAITSDVNAGATARNESFSVKGAAAITDVFSHLYPAGSSCSVSGQLVDAQANNSSGNLLTNGDFETFTTTDTPDNFVILLGAASTQIFSSGSSDAYTQSNALKLTGAAGVLTTLYQPFNTTASTTAGAGGTPGRVYPGRVYAFHGKIKAISAAPVAGVLRVAITDSANAVLNNDFGSALSFDTDLTLITTGFTSFSGVFSMPTNLPSVVRLQLKTTTAVTNTSSVVIDDIAFTEMTELYAGGPRIAGFSCSTNAILNDAWTFAVSSTRGVMADWLERLFSLREKGLQFPYDDAAGETIADSLVA